MSAELSNHRFFLNLRNRKFRNKNFKLNSPKSCWNRCEYTTDIRGWGNIMIIYTCFLVNLTEPHTFLKVRMLNLVMFCQNSKIHSFVYPNFFRFYLLKTRTFLKVERKRSKQQKFGINFSSTSRKGESLARNNWLIELHRIQSSEMCEK